MFDAGTPVTALTTDYVLAVADVNNDTKDDLIVAGAINGRNLSVHMGNGDGTFQAPITISEINAGYGGREILTGHFNADTNLDVAVVSWDGPDVRTLLGNGDGSFTLGAGLDAPGSHYQCGAVGFFNADAFPDIAVAGAGRGVFLGNGDGTFQAFAPLNPTSGGQGCAAADLNNDTFVDLVCAEGSNSTVYLGNGNGTFQTGTTTTGGGGGRVAVGDINGDGIPDVIARSGSGIKTSHGLGNGTLALPTAIAGPGVSITDLRSADLNRDGILDIITADVESGAAVWLGSGSNGFVPAVPVGPGGVEAREVATGDFNGDALPDLAVLRNPAGVIAILLQRDNSPIADPVAAAPALNGSVRAILPYLEQNNRAASEQTVVAGAFTKFGVTPLARIAMFDGAAYSPLASGLNGTVNALANFDLDAGNANPAVLIAGGAFTKSGAALKLPKIAAFDGKFWNPLGDATPVAPDSLHDVEGNTYDHLGINGTAYVCQIRYPESELHGLRPGDVITGLTFRLDNGQPVYPPQTIEWPRFDIAIGRGVDDLGTVFAKNFVGKPVKAHTGPLVIEAGAFQNTGVPHAFGVNIAFTKPFVYKGGPIVIETRTVAPASGINFWYDACYPPQTSGETIWAGGSASPADADLLESTSSDNYTWVLQFQTTLGPASGFNGNVNALVSGVFAGQTARGADPVLVAGGAFSKSGNTIVNRIAMWDGDKWVPIGAGFNGAVNALLIADLDGNGPNGPVLVAGGAFTKSGAAVLNRIAFFDGANWQPLGTGLSGAVNALAIHNFGEGPQLVAGGAFTKAGLTPLNRVARFDGQNWSPIGEGFKGTVNSLVSEALLDPGAPALIAGGAFTKSGLDVVNRLAIWQNNAWVQLGDGAPNTVRALARTDNDHSALGPHFKVGGDFKKIGALVQPFVTAFGCPSDILRAGAATLPAGVVPPCSIADIAGGGDTGNRPDGQVTVDDALAFMHLIGDAAPEAWDALDEKIDERASDDAEPLALDDAVEAAPLDIPEGETSLTDDVIAFVQAYLDGCP